jgi:hypothetical protein
MKTEVYSWRLSSDLKSGLEAEARRRKISLSALLDQIASEWLRNGRAKQDDDEAEQARLHAAAEKYIGTVPLGLGPYTNKRVHEIICDNLMKKYGRKRSR